MVPPLHSCAQPVLAMLQSDCKSPAYEALSQSTLYTTVLCMPALNLTEVKAIYLFVYLFCGKGMERQPFVSLVFLPKGVNAVWLAGLNNWYFRRGWKTINTQKNTDIPSNSSNIYKIYSV